MILLTILSMAVIMFVFALFSSLLSEFVNFIIVVFQELSAKF